AFRGFIGEEWLRRSTVASAGISSPAVFIFENPVFGPISFADDPGLFDPSRGRASSLARFRRFWVNLRLSTLNPPGSDGFDFMIVRFDHQICSTGNVKGWLCVRFNPSGWKNSKASHMEPVGFNLNSRRVRLEPPVQR